MKQAIVGYITALVNTHYDAVERLQVQNIQGKRSHISFINELNAILDFIEDIPEDTSLVINIGNSEETELLRKRIKELEESCEAMCEVEINLHNQIKALKDDNFMWQGTCDVLREGNKSLEQKVKDLTDELEGI